MKEYWKEIENYPNYQISNLGNIKSLNYNRRGFEQTLTPIINAHGYYIINLYNAGKMKTFKVHHLMGIVFFNYYTIKGFTIDHKDHNPLNNNINNLQIITHRENNTKDRTNKNGFTGVNKKGNVYQSKINIDGKYKHIGMFKTAEDAGNAYLVFKKTYVR